MLIRLNRPDIIENIQSRFNARETGQRPPLELDDTIKLVLDIDKVLFVPTLDSFILTPTAIGWYTCFTVPDGERWLLHNIRAQRSGAGDATYDGVRVGDGTVTCLLYATTATTGLTNAFASQPWLESGWVLQIDVAVWTTGNTEVQILYDAYEGY